MDQDSIGSNVKLYDFISGNVKKLFHMNRIETDDSCFSSDCQKMLFTFAENTDTNIMLVENFR